MKNKEPKAEKLKTAKIRLPLSDFNLQIKEIKSSSPIPDKE